MNKKALSILICGIAIVLFGMLIDSIFIFGLIGIIMAIVGFCMLDSETAEIIKYSIAFIFGGIVASIVGYILFGISAFIGILLIFVGIVALCFGLYSTITVIKVITRDTGQSNNTQNSEPFKNNSTIPNTYTDIYSNSSNSNNSKTVLPDGEKNYDLFDEIYEKCILCYEYEKNICLCDNATELIKGKGGHNIMFCQEPENQYDPKAVALYLNGEKIGYVYRGKIQDMINDWIKRNHTFLGYINKYSLTENKATYKIAFYKPLDMFPSTISALTKTSKKIDEFTSRQDNLLSCEEGDTIIVEYDLSADTYVVFTGLYEEIGELSKKGIDFCEEYSDFSIKGYINTYQIDENEKIRASVSLYAIPDRK